MDEPYGIPKANAWEVGTYFLTISTSSSTTHTFQLGSELSDLLAVSLHTGTEVSRMVEIAIQRYQKIIPKMGRRRWRH